MLYNNGLVISTEQARAIDAAAISQLGITGLLLMENASRGVCEVLESEFGLTNPNSVLTDRVREHSRLTQMRDIVFSEVLRAARIFQLDDILASANQSAASQNIICKADVYRTVSELADAGLVVMEATATSARVNFGRAFIVCGPGNNGGDGIALTRHCHAQGLPAKLLLVRGEKELSHDARSNLEFLIRAGVEFEDLTVDELSAKLLKLESDDVIVDCLLGTGSKGPPREPFRSAIEAINRSSAQILAVDAPSGLDCNSGIAAGACVKANRTVTFVGIKRGFQQTNAALFTGDVSVAHIGIPLSWLHKWLLANPPN